MIKKFVSIRVTTYKPENNFCVQLILTALYKINAGNSMCNSYVGITY